VEIDPQNGSQETNRLTECRIGQMDPPPWAGKTRANLRKLIEACHACFPV
jgi:hypothetical protein